MTRARLPFAITMAAMLALLPVQAARAEIVLSDLIVELSSGTQAPRDIEIWNNSPERAYIAIDPAEIVSPGTPSEQRRSDPDPQKLGLLVSPSRMVLEAGQRKLIRIAVIAPNSDRERVYRVTTRPVPGQLSSDASGLKIVVGYDVLVLVRPAAPEPAVNAARAGGMLTFHNTGNVSVELVDGRQCRSNQECSVLPSKRLYAGAEWSIPVNPVLPADYLMKSPAGSVRRHF